MRFLFGKRSTEKMNSFLLQGWCLFSLFFLLFPIVVVIAVSFTKTGYLVFPPKGLTLNWYRLFLHDSTYIGSLQFSFILACIVSLLSAVAGTSAALALVRSRFWGRSFLSSLFLSPLILPHVVIGAGLLQFLSVVGLVRSFSAFIIGHAIITFPYIIRTVAATLEGYDTSIEEAAQDLGANRLKTFFLVTLPLIKPGIIAGVLFVFIVSWTNVEVSMFLSTSAMDPIPVKIFNYVQYTVDPMIAAVSAATIYLAFIIIIIIDLTVGMERFSGTN